MRIIAGKFGARSFNSPKGHKTHPMSEKIRGALFNALGDIEDLTILDAFAGSGALAFEAISRGAANAVAIDHSKEAIAVMKQTVRQFGITNQVAIVQATCLQWSSTNQGVLFDIVLCDPPYDDIQSRSVISMYAHVKPGGLLVLSLPPNVQMGEFPGSETLLHKDYGDATLTFVRKLGK